MDYGLLVKNANNKIQIDSQYQNMVELARGNASYRANSVCGTHYCIIPFDFSKHPEAVIAVRPRNGDSVCSIKRSGSTFEVKVYNYNYATSSGPLDYIIYGVVPTSSPSTGYGLRVRNSVGKIVFDSGYNYLKITDVMVFNVGSSDEYQYIVRRNIPSGKPGLYILSMTSVCSSEQFGPQARGYFPIKVRFNTASSVEVDNMSETDVDDFTLFLVDPN